MRVEPTKLTSDFSAQCEGKRRYATIGELKKSFPRKNRPYTPYRCPHCLGWHVSDSKRKQLGTARKRAMK